MPCCSANRFQRSSAITSIRLETERFSKEAICSSLFRCSSRTVRLSFGLFLFFLDFAIGSSYTSFFNSRSRRLKAINLYAELQIPDPSANDDGRAALGKVISKIFQNLESPIP